jgi:hypothetical protein
MFGRKACSCAGRFGGKTGAYDRFSGKALSRTGGNSSDHTKHITVDRAFGAGDMGPDRDKLLGNTHSGLANGQRDIQDYGNAQSAMQKRKMGNNPIESSKKNKAM